MEIIYNRNSTVSAKHSLSLVFGERKESAVLQHTEKELLEQMNQVMSVVYGGEFKNAANLFRPERAWAVVRSKAHCEAPCEGQIRASEN